MTGSISGWRRCREALSSDDLVSDASLAGGRPLRANNLLFMDGEPHRRLRGLVMPYFTSHRLEALGDRLEETARSLLAAALENPGTDLVAEVAEPLVLEAILTAMEVAEDRRERLGALSREMFGLLEPDLPAPAQRRASGAAVRATMLFRRDQREGRATGLHAALEDAAAAGAIPAKLARSTPVVVLHGGYENPLNQLGCILARAVEGPEGLGDAADPAPLFEEVMRAFSPVRLLARWVATEAEGPGAPGELVWIDLESANQEGDPDAAGVDRGRPRHLGFGYGPHACLGTALARIEGRALIAALAQAPVAQLREFTVRWRDGAVTRGPAEIVREDPYARSQVRSPSGSE